MQLMYIYTVAYCYSYLCGADTLVLFAHRSRAFICVSSLSSIYNRTCPAFALQYIRIIGAPLVVLVLDAHPVYPLSFRVLLELRASTASAPLKQTQNHKRNRWEGVPAKIHIHAIPSLLALLLCTLSLLVRRSPWCCEVSVREPRTSSGSGLRRNLDIRLGTSAYSNGTAATRTRARVHSRLLLCMFSRPFATAESLCYLTEHVSHGMTSTWSMFRSFCHFAMATQALQSIPMRNVPPLYTMI